MRFLRLPATSNRTGLPRSTLYQLMAAGKFPKQVKISPKIAAWIEDEVEAWLAERVAERDAAQPRRPRKTKAVSAEAVS
jgi:prophage regulatory protein